MVQLGEKVNLVICQKSKIDDWVEHFENNYHDEYAILDLTYKTDFEKFKEWDAEYCPYIAVINYDLIWRRPELKKLQDFTLLLDESSLIQNESAKRSKFILKLNAKNVILLSGTPTGGKYENLWSQLHLLGWNISKKLYWSQYVDYEIDDSQGFPIKIVKGYKNIERLKKKMRSHGCHFLKTEDVMTLPEQVHTTVDISMTKEYRIFRKKSIVNINDVELVGDTTLTKMLYERMLCGQYNQDKLKAFKDLINSTNDRLIVFYNFTSELDELLTICNEQNRPTSVVNGKVKELINYENKTDSVTFIQYQAGAMGLNLQKANKIIYFTLPLSSELFEQSKKRIHRIGQKQTCFYYYLICRNSIETQIYDTLQMRKDYTDKLFEEGK